MGTDTHLTHARCTLIVVALVALSLPAIATAQVTQLYSNGSLANVPNGGAGGAPASRLRSSLGMSTLGFGADFLSSHLNAVADDFTVPWPGWTITRITVYGYQADSGFLSSLKDLRLVIMNGPPNAPGSAVVFGNPTVNVLASTSFTNVFRDSETNPGSSRRPIMAAVANVYVPLPAGTYWLVWAIGGRLADGPYVPPIAASGQTTTGNGLHLSGNWTPAIDTSAGTQQGFPFVLEGTGAGGGTPPSLTVSTNTSSLRAGDRLTLTASLTAGTGLVDAYVVIDLPGGGTLSLTPGGLVAGTVPYARRFTSFAFSGTLLSIVLPRVPLGTYRVRAVLTVARTSTPASAPSQTTFSVVP